MRITSLSLNIKEDDYELYESELCKKGWQKIGGQHVYRKAFQDTEVELKEHVPTFGTEITLKVSARNEDGIELNILSDLLAELANADKTEDE
ncbi:hypothetical protein IC620_02340 [Hazenella sp. IB182357]|uniref:Uncharacterized protein n=1 Tax=Polycladospora coralii TaxID=2771432 RepID=A0A926N7P2_9BACL|nr:hypothetical protein [Polycladospora coralii]MBD1371197.1 hypothetical protein [Polycladospora coralii]MBS7530139.1 hypothetical protein [Polycladospora coralii]